MSSVRNNRGFIKVFLVLAILVALVFAGISFGLPYYRYFTLSSRTGDVLKGEIGGNTQFVHDKVMEFASELKVPLNAEDVVVAYDMGRKITKVEGHWSETVDFFGLYQHKINFTLDEEL